MKFIWFKAITVVWFFCVYMTSVSKSKNGDPTKKEKQKMVIQRYELRHKGMES